MKTNQEINEIAEMIISDIATNIKLKQYEDDVLKIVSKFAIRQWCDDLNDYISKEYLIVAIMENEAFEACCQQTNTTPARVIFHNNTYWIGKRIAEDLEIPIEQVYKVINEI